MMAENMAVNETIRRIPPMQLKTILAGLAVSLLSSMAWTPGAQARLCATDSAPAATLLYPYFEADVSDLGCAAGAAKTTLVTMRNVTAVPTLAFVTLWSNWATPVLGFNVYLAGQDEQTVDLHALLCQGDLPQTGTFFSNHGDLSVPAGAVSYPGCNITTVAGFAPAYAGATGPPQSVAHGQAVVYDHGLRRS